MFLQFLPAIAVAVAVAAALSACALLGKGGGASRAVAACALGAGYFAGHNFITGWTPFPPTDTTNWLPYFALAAAAIGSLACLVDGSAARLVVFGLVCVGAMRLLLAPKFAYGWSAAEGWLWVAGLGGLALVLAIGIAAMARRAWTAIETPLLLVVVSAGTAGALMLSGSLLLGQFGTVLSAVVLGSLVLTCRGRTYDGGAALVFSLVFAALLVCGYFFAELPALSAVLLAAAPFGTLVSRAISAPRWAAAVRLAVVVAIAGGALFAAYCSSPSWGE